MKIVLGILALAIGLFLGMNGVGGRSSDKSVHVQGYTRSDGTQVSGYDRSPPGTK